MQIFCMHYITWKCYTVNSHESDFLDIQNAAIWNADLHNMIFRRKFIELWNKSSTRHPQSWRWLWRNYLIDCFKMCFRLGLKKASDNSYQHFNLLSPWWQQFCLIHTCFFENDKCSIIVQFCISIASKTSADIPGYQRRIFGIR